MTLTISEAPYTNWIRKHRPAACHGLDGVTAFFNTKEELLAIPFVAEYTEPPWFGKWTFHKFSMCRPKDANGYALLVEFNEGANWWVVGFCEQDVEDLPTWDWVEGMKVRRAKYGEDA